MARVALTLCVSVCLMASASAYFSNDLAGCKAFIAKFDNTCTSATQDAGGWSTTASWVSAYTNCDTATYSGYTSAYCPGTWDSASSTCKNIPHQLCASCSTVSGTVYIRIQSNLCPRRCGGGSAASYKCTWTSDWTVKWQPSVGTPSNPTYQESLGNSDVKSSGQMCVLGDSPLHYQNIPTNSNWTYTTDYYTASSYLAMFGTASKSGVNAIGAGIDMAGGALAAYVSGTALDPLFPNPYSSASVEGFDGTLSHPDANGIMHYHTPSPFNAKPGAISYSSATTGSNPFAACTYRNGKGAYVYASGTKTWCVSTTADASTGPISNAAKYIPASFVAAGMNTATPIGLSRDGHIIYGPYDASGALFTQVDACGGVFDTKGNYVYVGQVTSPYIQGCFGPVDWTGSSSGKTPECSTNARAINDFAYSSYTFNSGSTMNAVEVEAETEEAIEEEASL